MFFWKILSHLAALTYLLLHTSFNPCFSGRSSLIRSFRAELCSLKVSILVFLEDPLSYKHLTKGTACHILFQSLFFWKILSHTAENPLAKNLIRCFNPCFSGRSSLIGQGGPEPVGRLWVSILVFLEDPLSSLPDGPNKQGTIGVSILVFLEDPLS